MGMCEDGWHFVRMGGGGDSSILPVFLAPSLSLPLHLSHSRSLFSVSLSLGGFVLTEAVCGRHRLCCLEEESGREREKENQREHWGEPLAIETWGDGLFTIWLHKHCPVEINQSGNQRMTEMLTG